MRDTTTETVRPHTKTPQRKSAFCLHRIVKTNTHQHSREMYNSQCYAHNICVHHQKMPLQMCACVCVCAQSSPHQLSAYVDRCTVTGSILSGNHWTELPFQNNYRTLIPYHYLEQPQNNILYTHCPYLHNHRHRSFTLDSRLRTRDVVSNHNWLQNCQGLKCQLHSIEKSNSESIPYCSAMDYLF